MPTNSKGKKGLSETLFDTVGSVSYLVGSLVLVAIAIGTISGIFISTKRLIQIRQERMDEDGSNSEPEGQGR